MRIYVLIFFSLIFFYFIYQNVKHPQVRLNNPLDRLAHPTDTRLRYKIAEIDPRFGLSQQEVIQLSQEAALIWKSALAKDLLIYDPNAKLTINFYYDERQEMTKNRLKHENKVISEQNQWASKNNKMSELKAEIQQLNALLKSQNTEYETQVRKHNEHVALINQKQYINTEERQNIQQQKEYLHQQKLQLDKFIINYNQKIAELNTQVNELNQINQNINLQIEEYNQKFKPRLFDKGNFDGQNINIFEFQSKDDLRLTLAHEFGHALGLGHHQNPKGLMHPMMQEQEQHNFQLQPADIQLFYER